MGSQVWSSGGATSVKEACPHGTVWVVETAGHRVVRKPCSACHGIEITGKREVGSGDGLSGTAA